MWSRKWWMQLCCYEFERKSMIRKQKLNKGFTLIELLIVIVIIGILATFLMVNFVGVRQRARDAQRKSDLRQIQSGLELYRSDTGAYPANDAFGDAKCGLELADGLNIYIKKIPCDPLTSDAYPYATANFGYSVQTCLENLNDLQKDLQNDATYGCDGTSNWSYTLQNP